jgi:hypothetical protein
MRFLLIVATLSMTIMEAAASERCSASLRAADGSVRVVELYSVEEAAPPLTLPPEASGAFAVICLRRTLYMSDKDYRVLTDLHLPFAFSDGDRVVWLYVENLRLLMQLDDGELTKEEREAIESAIGRAQEIMLRDGW